MNIQMSVLFAQNHGFTEWKRLQQPVLINRRSRIHHCSSLLLLVIVLLLKFLLANAFRAAKNAKRLLVVRCWSLGHSDLMVDVCGFERS